MAISGSLSIRIGETCFVRHFSDHGWFAAELVGHLDSLLQADDAALEVLKLLGYLVQIDRTFPPRTAAHWVEVDLDKRVLTTNSEVIRKAVMQKPPDEVAPYSQISLDRIYGILDAFDFTVRLLS